MWTDTLGLGCLGLFSWTDTLGLWCLIYPLGGHHYDRDLRSVVSETCLCQLVSLPKMEASPLTLTL